MRIGWLNKSSRGRVIIFFTGWGMDVNSVSHLKGEYDVLVIYDYNDISVTNLPDLNSYKEIYVIAWSMGVWAAANILSYW
ncbi:MAG: DUF452 family protein, partial [Odoribacter sp.]|nr:DUF452 family protein [Odoribacter sp.]